MAFSRDEKIQILVDLASAQAGNPEQVARLFGKLDDTFLDVFLSLIHRGGLSLRYGTLQPGNLGHRIAAKQNYYDYAENALYWDYDSLPALKHEVAHSVDALFRDLTTTYVLDVEKGQTFYEILFEELRGVFPTALDEALEDFRSYAERNGCPEVFERAKPHLFAHGHLYALDEARKLYAKSKYLGNEYWPCEYLLYRRLLEGTYIEDVLEAFEDISMSRFSFFGKQRPPLASSELLVEMLSLGAEFKCFSLLYGHGHAYYLRNPSKIASEIFAMLTETYDLTKQELSCADERFLRYFPRSVAAFRQLWSDVLGEIREKGVPSIPIHFGDEEEVDDEEEDPLPDVSDELEEELSCADDDEDDEPYDDLAPTNMSSFRVVSALEQAYSRRDDTPSMWAFPYPKEIREERDWGKQNAMVRQLFRGLDKEFVALPKMTLERLRNAYRPSSFKGLHVLTSVEAKVLGDSVSMLLYVRQADFRFMFGEKLKYLPALIWKSIREEDLSFRLFVLSSLFHGRLSSLVGRMARKYYAKKITEDGIASIESYLQAFDEAAKGVRDESH